MADLDRARVRRPLRPHDGRPGPARRHRPVDRGRARPDLRRRGGGLRRRQVHPRVDGPGHATRARGRPRTRSSPTPWSSTTGASSRPTSASGTAGSSRSGRTGNPDIADGVHPDLAIGPSHRRHLRRGPDPHRRRHRRARPLPVHLPGARGPRHRDHDRRRRRHGTVRGVQGHHGHSRPLAPADGAPGLDHLPVNVLLMGKGNTSARQGSPSRRWPAPRHTRCTRTGAPRPRPSTRRCAPPTSYGLQVALHSDSLNEAGFLESTLAAIGGRSIHAFHTEGAGGGHAPDIIDHRRPPPRDPRLDEPDPAAHGQHRRRAPRHADGLPPPQPAGPRGPGLRRVPDPGDHDRGRGRPARHGRAVDHVLRRAGDGPDRRGHLAAPGRWPT